MPNKRDINLIKYGISKNRVKELKGYCYQYEEWRDKLKYDTDAIKGQQITGMPFGGGTSNSTMNMAMKREMLFQKCQSIEQTMIEAITTLKKGETCKYVYDGDYQDIYPHMLKSVTDAEITYTYLWEVMRIKIGRDTFNQLRRYFYFLLDKNKL